MHNIDGGFFFSSALSGSRRAVAKLHVFASTLEKTCLKRSYADEAQTEAQPRYVAIVPREEKEGEASASVEYDGDEWRGRLKTWRRGKLVFWKTHEAFCSDEEPKCALEIMSIARVERVLLQPLQVLIKYKDAGLLKECMLQFGSEEEASSWSGALRDMRALLQYSVRHASNFG